ncbi:hypothetical protein SFRURICE_003607 [Spodoptera frugiperda]|nr:hypothetical protein SFRURICE_003607 [Spodoptera frugiperda]
MGLIAQMVKSGITCLNVHLYPFGDKRPIKVSVHRAASYASHATDFSLSCIETYTTASTNSHCTDAVNPLNATRPMRTMRTCGRLPLCEYIRNSYNIGNAYMRCVPMMSYGMRAMRTMRVCGRLS